MPNCPLCNTNTMDKVRDFTSEQVANAHVIKSSNFKTFEQLRNHLETLWKRPYVEIYKCPRCQFGFADPFVAGDAVFYELSSFDTAYPKDKWEFQQTLAALRSADPRSDGKILEIGSGKGYFLQHLLNQGFSRSDLLAVEYSTTGISAIEALKVRCLNYDIRSYETDRKFDFICMFQILEHMDNYDSLFEKLRQLMKTNGSLFISVPSGERIAKNENLQLLWDCPPNHISRWSPKSLAVLAQKYNFQIEGCEFEPTDRKYEFTYGFVNRYVRRAQDEGTWENKISTVASKLKNKKHARLVKAFGAATSKTSWTTALKASRDILNHSIWVQLKMR